MRVSNTWHGQTIGAMVLIVFLLSTSSNVSAFWKKNEDIVHNGAYTLDEEEFLIGIFTPLQYGVLEDLTISLHPFLELLLTPNVGLRYQVLKEPVGVSLTAGYVQTFIREREEGGYPGRLEFGSMVSIPLNNSMVVTPYLGYLMDFATLDSVVQVEEVMTTRASGSVDFATRENIDTLDFLIVRHGLSYGMGFNWIINSENILLAQIRAVVALNTSLHELPQFSLLWAHAWKKTRVAIGMAAGAFPFQTGGGFSFDLPVYPILDLWIRI